MLEAQQRDEVLHDGGICASVRLHDVFLRVQYVEVIAQPFFIAQFSKLQLLVRLRHALRLQCHARLRLFHRDCRLHHFGQDVVLRRLPGANGRVQAQLRLLIGRPLLRQVQRERRRHADAPKFVLHFHAVAEAVPLAAQRVAHRHVKRRQQVLPSDVQLPLRLVNLFLRGLQFQPMLQRLPHQFIEIERDRRVIQGRGEQITGVQRAAEQHVELAFRVFQRGAGVHEAVLRGQRLQFRPEHVHFRGHADV